MVPCRLKPFFFLCVPSEAPGYDAAGSQGDLAGPEEGLWQTAHPQHHIPLPGRPAGLRRPSLHLRNCAPHQQGQPHHSAAGEQGTVLRLWLGKVPLAVLVYEAVSVSPARRCTNLVLLKYLATSRLRVSVSRLSSLVRSRFYFAGNI